MTSWQVTYHTYVFRSKLCSLLLPGRPFDLFYKLASSRYSAVSPQFRPANTGNRSLTAIIKSYNLSVMLTFIVLQHTLLHWRIWIFIIRYTSWRLFLVGVPDYRLLASSHSKSSVPVHWVLSRPLLTISKYVGAVAGRVFRSLRLGEASVVRREFRTSLYSISLLLVQTVSLELRLLNLKYRMVF